MYLRPESAAIQVVVYARPRPSSGEFYEARFEHASPGVLRQVVMSHHGQQEYMAKGIPEAVLLEMRRRFGCRIESSPSYDAGAGQFRGAPANRVWDRLVRRGLAVWDEQRAIYSLV